MNTERKSRNTCFSSSVFICVHLWFYFCQVRLVVEMRSSPLLQVNEPPNASAAQMRINSTIRQLMVSAPLESRRNLQHPNCSTGRQCGLVFGPDEQHIGRREGENIGRAFPYERPDNAGRAVEDSGLIKFARPVCRQCIGEHPACPSLR